MPDLILRATNSPYGDTNKGSVLSQTELDTNFITLKGLDSTNLSLNGNILSLERYSGDNLLVDLSSINTYTTGATYSNNTFTFNNNSGTSFNVLFNTMTGLTVNGTINVQNSSFTGTNLTIAKTAINTQVITGGPAGENITFGPSNRIFLNAGQVSLGQNYLTNVGTLETINRVGSAGDAMLMTVQGSLLGAAGITQNAFRIAVTVAQQQASPVANILHINPTYNNTGTTGTAIIRGIYYNPVLSSLTNTNHIAIETVTGNNLFGTTSGNTLIGTTVDSGFKLNVSGTTRLNGDLTLTSGTNKTTDVVVLTGGNPSTVVVNNSLVKTTSLILLTKQTAVYSAGTASILTKTNGSFTIISSANGDTDSVGYLIINTT